MVEFRGTAALTPTTLRPTMASVMCCYGQGKLAGIGSRNFARRHYGACPTLHCACNNLGAVLLYPKEKLDEAIRQAAERHCDCSPISPGQFAHRPLLRSQRRTRRGGRRGDARPRPTGMDERNSDIAQRIGRVLAVAGAGKPLWRPSCRRSLLA